jgi:hypothetical protein
VCRRRLKIVSWLLVCTLLGSSVVFSATTVYLSHSYKVPLAVAARGVIRQCQLATIAFFVNIYDPCYTRWANVGPCEDVKDQGELRAEVALVPGKSLAIESGMKVMAEEIRNEKIKVGRGTDFRYQPFDDPRLVELREKYHLDEIVAQATDEFGAMVLLRNWVRSQFRRQDYQPETANFDALEILDRGYRNHGLTRSAARFYDPCHFFPMLYCQVMLSMGHQARLMSTTHGMAEVWSNQFHKWIVMDAELNLHYEKDGVPMNMVELLDENYGSTPTRVRIVCGEQTSGDANTTMVHLKVHELSVPDTVAWFDTYFELVDLRNDWLTNHYFPGHPARSEGNGLIYVDKRVHGSIDFAERLRPRTSERDELYWTLNQAEIRIRSMMGQTLDVAFRTITPNFKCFEVVVDGNATSSCGSPTFQWKLHEGINTLAVRPVNQFHVRGLESYLRLNVVHEQQSPNSN